MRGRAPRVRPRALSALRRWRGLSTGDLADRLEMDLRSYERLESGEIGLSVTRLLDISAACDGDTVGLFAGVAFDLPALAASVADTKLLERLARRLAILDPDTAERLARSDWLEVIAPADPSDPRDSP